MGLPKLPKEKFIIVHDNASKSTVHDDDLAFAENLALKIHNEYIKMGLDISSDFVRFAIMQIATKNNGAELIWNPEMCYQEYNLAILNVRTKVDGTITGEGDTKDRGDEETAQTKFTNKGGKSKLLETHLPNSWFERGFSKDSLNGVGFVDNLSVELSGAFKARGVEIEPELIGFFLSEMVSEDIDIRNPVDCKRVLIQKLEKADILIVDNKGIRLSTAPPQPIVNIIRDEFGLPAGAFKKAHEKAEGNGIVYVESLAEHIKTAFAQIGLAISEDTIRRELVTIITNPDRIQGGWNVIKDSGKCKKRLYAVLRNKIV